MKSCNDYPGAPPCCGSCHYDAEEYFPAYPLSEVEDANGNVIAEVCCAVLDYARKVESSEGEAK